MNKQEQNQVPHAESSTGKQLERLLRKGKRLMDRDVDRTEELSWDSRGTIKHTQDTQNLGMVVGSSNPSTQDRNITNSRPTRLYVLLSVYMYDVCMCGCIDVCMRVYVCSGACVEIGRQSQLLVPTFHLIWDTRLACHQLPSISLSLLPITIYELCE